MWALHAPSSIPISFTACMCGANAVGAGKYTTKPTVQRPNNDQVTCMAVSQSNAKFSCMHMGGGA